ncbi:hypothetical protein, partial [Desulfobacter sp.]|uniref:hypothetical protein n=1 Tax=Desulfobacter sp. TaxID=2294 RepID=UPI003D134571
MADNTRISKIENKTAPEIAPSLRACLVIRESKRNLMKMRTNFFKFSVNSRTIDIKFGRIGAIFMRLQPIHQLPNKLLG